MSRLVGLIPAAGRGVRAYPYTRVVPKAMLDVDGVPLLRRNVELMRDQLEIDEIVIVLGHHGEAIRSYFGNGSALGVVIRYVENDRLELDLPYSIYLGGKGIRDYCCVLLSDECYIETNHRELRRFPYQSAMITCGVIQAEYPKHVKKNYTVSIVDGAIVGLVEKPKSVSGLTMGTGTYVLHPDVLQRLAERFEAEPADPPRDWTTWIDELRCGGATVLPFHLSGRYVNVNSRDDLNYANLFVRDVAFEDRRTSLVYLVDDHADVAGAPVRKFADLADVDEVLAVSRTFSSSLEEAARHPKVNVVVHPDRMVGLGALLKYGLDRTKGDIVMISYSDDTFSPKDVAKLLVYLRDADMVLGTRTTRQMIEQGTNMRGIVRAAHVFFGKLIELLWWQFSPRLTDVCCVYRALWRSTYLGIRDQLTSSGVEIFPEMVIETVRARRRIIEIPVNYYNHDLEYEHVRSKYQSFETFSRILSLIVRKRVGSVDASAHA